MSLPSQSTIDYRIISTSFPQDNAEFVSYALLVYPNLNSDGPTANPDYGVGWHYQKSLNYNATEAQQRVNILQDIIDLYFLNGAPTGNGNPDLRCVLDTMNINIVNGNVIVTGGVEPYEISIDTTGSLQTVTVMDFDSCVTTAPFTISSLSEVFTEGLRVFPNPTTGEIQIDFGTLQDQVTISTIDLMGKLIKTQTIVTSKLVSYQLPKSAGVYVLNITFTDGKYRSVRVVKE